jgi:hypothetical protein
MAEAISEVAKARCCLMGYNKNREKPEVSEALLAVFYPND